MGNGCTHRKRPPAALLEIARRVGPHGRIDPGAQCLIANRPLRGDVVTVRASLNQRCGPPREPLNSKRARVLRAFPAIYANDNFSLWESQFAEPASSEFSYQEKRNVRLRIRSCYGTFSRRPVTKTHRVMSQRRALEQSSWPKLSEAMQLLPLISDNIVAAVARHPLYTGLELLPIVEGGLFGYELVPDREAHTYLIIGRDSPGVPALRSTSYGVGAPNALQLIAVDGRLLSRQERAARYRLQRRDTVFVDWFAAAEAACQQLNSLFAPQKTPNRITGPGRMHRHLEEPLCVAYSHLAQRDPSIAFFGLPNEAQMGFALTDVDGDGGELVFQQPDTWKLRWTAPPDVVDESWSITKESPISKTPTEHGQFHVPDRRMHRRRASDRNDVPCSWPGTERREARGRRTMDRCNP